MASSSRDFEVYFVLSLIYSQGFRRYALDKVRSDWLIDWQARYLFDLMLKMDKLGRQINFMSVLENSKRDTSISDSKREDIENMIAPFIEEPSSPILQSMMDAVVPIVEDEIGKTLLLKGIIKAQDFVERGALVEVFKLFKDIERQSIFKKEVSMSFWNDSKKFLKDMAIDPWIRGIPLFMYGQDSNFSEVTLDQELYYKGLGRKNLGILMGLASSGKSTLFLNMAAPQSLCGYKVNIYSLELDPKYMQLRILSILTDVPTFDIEKRKEEVDGSLQEILRVRDNVGEIKISHHKAHDLTPHGIVEDIERDRADRGIPDMIYVDYADILGSTRKWSERRHEIGYNIEELRGVAQEYNCGLMTASQSNREGFKKKWGKYQQEGENRILTRGELSEDFSKAFTADLIVTVNSEVSVGTTIDNKPERKENVAAYIDKNRFGKEGFTIDLGNVNRSVGRFFDPFRAMEIFEERRGA